MDQKNNPQQDVQKMVMQLELGRKQMDQMNRQAQAMESAIIEATSTVEALNALKTQKTGSEMLIQVGSGAFVKTTLKDNENVIVGVGAQISVEKKLPDAIKSIEERREQLTQSMSHTQKTMGELAVKMAELQKAAEKIIGPMNQ